MKMGIKILALFFVFYSSAAFSLAYEMKVQGGIGLNEWGSVTPWTYDRLSIESWDINDDTPNPMLEGSYYEARDDNLYFTYNDDFNNNQIPSKPSYTVPGARKAKTMGELGRLFIAQGYLGKEITGIRTSHWYWHSCYKFEYYSKRAGSWGFANTICISPEIPPAICRVNEPYVEINHGVLAPAKINGHSAYADFHITCSSQMSVIVGSQAKVNSVSLSSANGGKLRSDLTINERKLGDGVKVVASTSPTRLRLSSTLSNYDAQSVGEFSGSLPIIIAIP